MLRTILKPNAPRINLSIPADYVGEEVEVLVFPINSADNLQQSANEVNAAANTVPVFGCLKGQIQMSDDFDEPLDDFKDYMGIHNDELIIKSAERKPRHGWNEAFAKMSEAKADKLLLPDNIDSAAFEWVW
jgi:hypothetical protein